MTCRLPFGPNLDLWFNFHLEFYSFNFGVVDHPYVTKLVCLESALKDHQADNRIAGVA